MADDRPDHHDRGDEQGHDHHRTDEHSRGWRAAVLSVRSVFSPHSHDAADSIDAALDESDEGPRALKISLAALALTAMLQLVVVLASGSVALLADSIHNFADALTALPLGFAFWLGRRPATRRYTYGYGRSEDLAGVAIVVTIAASAVVAGWEAATRLVDHRQVTHVGWVIAAGALGAVGNELVALYRIRVGRRIGSAALVADGLHARTDGLTSLGVVVGGIGVAAGLATADPVVGLLITAAVLVVLKNAGRDVYRRLMDAVDPELVDEVERVLVSVRGVEEVESVRIRWIGHELRAEAEVISDADMSLADAHAIAEEARHQLLHRIGRLREAAIHTSPCSHGGRDPHAVTAHHRHDVGPSPETVEGC